MLKEKENGTKKIIIHPPFALLIVFVLLIRFFIFGTEVCAATVVSGNVVTSNNTAIPGVFVYFWNQNTSTGDGGQTDTDGNFSLSLADGDYDISLYNIPSNVSEVAPSGMTISISNNTISSFNDGTTTTPSPSSITITLKAPNVTGRVEESDGTGVSGVWVSFWNQNTSTGGGGQTDVDGNFSLSLADGDYDIYLYNIPSNVSEVAPSGMTISISSNTISSFNDGTTTTQSPSSITITLKAPNVTGKVVKSNGTGVSGVLAAFWNQNTSAWGGWDQTDVDGDFSLSLADGDYDIYLYDIPSNVSEVAPSGMTISISSNTISSFNDGTTTTQSPSSITITLKAPNVTGKVVKSNGTGVSGILVAFWNTNTSAWSGWDQTEADGNFSLVLVDGNYNVYLYDIPSAVGEVAPKGMKIIIGNNSITSFNDGTTTTQSPSSITIRLKAAN